MNSDRIKQYIFQMPWWELLLLGVLFKTCLSQILYLISPEGFNNPAINHSMFRVFVEALVLAPIAETCINQFLPIELNAILKKKLPTVVIVIISAVIFGLSHTYSFIYAIYTFFIGLYLATYYVIIRQRSSQPRNAFWTVTFCHFIFNLTTFCDQFFSI